MAKRAHRTVETWRRPRATGRLLRQRSGGSARTGRAAAKASTLFRALVAEETPTAERIDVIRRGLGARIIDDMVDYLDVPKNVVFRVLHTPESTAHRLIRDNRALDPAVSERVVRVADITRMAEETFGGRAAAAQWLKSPNYALAGATPLSMLDTEPGASEVRRILSAIDYGGTF